MNVLIIDDYRSHGESLVELVEVLGHEAQYAPSYSEAEWLLSVLSFDVALLDFDMPQMTGPMIASEIAQRFPKVRPVIMSAHAPDTRRRQEIGEWTFLQKPLTRERLQALFSDFVREQRGCGLMLRGSFPILRIDARGESPSSDSTGRPREEETTDYTD
jgi:two-component system response regulator YesN